MHRGAAFLCGPYFLVFGMGADLYLYRIHKGGMKQGIGNTKTVDAVNILLIFISLVVAFKIPFHLFLFSYAVLGPLHYLTELSWLRDRDYFVGERKWAWYFVPVAIIITVPLLYGMTGLPVDHDTILGCLMRKHGVHLFISFLFVSFVLSVVLVYFRKWQYAVTGMVVSAVLMLLLIATDHFRAVAMALVFLPTIIHVYLFTFLFMVYGTVKTRNMAGIVSCIFLALVPLIIGTVVIDAPSYVPSSDVQATFFKSDFQRVSADIARMVGGLEENGSFFIGSEAGIRIQIFIAFCYTYHYLNWFSKTGVIGWGKGLTAPRTVVIGVLWLLSVGLYVYDYRIGFAALAALSLAHVLCELPLNVLSVKGTVGEVVQRIRGRSQTG